MSCMRRPVAVTLWEDVPDIRGSEEVVRLNSYVEGLTGVTRATPMTWTVITGFTVQYSAKVHSRHGTDSRSATQSQGTGRPVIILQDHGPSYVFFGYSKKPLYRITTLAIVVSSEMKEFSRCQATGLQVVPLWIDGKETTSSPERTFPVYSAKQEKNVYMAHSADTKIATQAVEIAWRSFESWRQTSANVRRDIILKAAEIFESKTKEIIAVQVEETSCEVSWAGFNLAYGLSNMREIAGSITSVFGEMPRVDAETNLALVFKEPVGPCLLISPWNAAFVLAVRGICSMLGAGCAVVFKASEHCPRTHNLLVQVFEEAGLPKGVLNVLQCQREDAGPVTECLVAHKAIRKVEFIGSPVVGRMIGQLCGKYLKPILMELGGKCAAVVLDDADLEDAAEKCIRGAFMHHGQICFSTERIIVLKTIAPQFIPLLKKKAADFAPGSGVSKDIVQKAYESLVEAQKLGATFLVGEPKYVASAELLPAIVTGVTKDMRLFDIETFGPSVSLYIAEDDEEAVSMANNSAYGLNASIHTTDMHRAVSLARRMEFGQIHVNSPTPYNEATFPIGGTKNSGWGRNNSRFGIEEFTQMKTVSLNMSHTKSTFGGRT